MKKLSDTLELNALNHMEVVLYKLPLLWQVEKVNLVARMVYYPKESGLLMNEAMCKVYDQNFSIEDEIESCEFLTAPYLLSGKPRMRGNLKWKKIKKIKPTKEDLNIPFFKRRGGHRSKELDTVSIQSLCKAKGFSMNKKFALELPIYQHSTSDFITYIMSFEYLKKYHKKPRLNLLDFDEEIREDMWKSWAFEMVFNEKY